MNRSARRDQIRAAQRHARQQADRIAKFHGMEQGRTLASQTPVWIKAQFDIARARFADGAFACPHLTSPQPVYGAVWRPGMFTCLACSDLLAAPAEENDLCDRCRKVSIPIIASMATLDVLNLQFGLCRPCATEVGALVPSSHP